MDIEFHYYITYILARKTNFNPDDAYTLAYSSQYVDDNTFHYYVNFEDGSTPYISEISQTMDITKPSSKRQKIYPLFHFIPGDPQSPGARRKDGRVHLFNTTPDNENARYFMTKALESNNLYRIGIATHGYADTWAHQNFLGLKDDFNAMSGLVEAILPNIGHADARHEPDRVDNRWKDERLVKELEIIDNNERFIKATECIFNIFWTCRNETDEGMTKNWEELKPRLSDAMDESYLLGGDDRARKRAYRRICPEIPDYEKNAWRHQAIDKKELETDLFDRYWAKEDFYTSSWYLFLQAVKKHREVALARLRPLYEEAGLPV